jgi:hypothetical protein
MGAHVSQRQVRISLAVLLFLLVAVNSAALVLYSRSLSGIRGDFCSWATVHYQAAQSIPHATTAQREAAASDEQLRRQLGCRGR